MSDHSKELFTLIESLPSTPPPSLKYELFEFIRKYWTEVGEDTTIQEIICRKLGITKALFNTFLENPRLVHGSEILARFLKPGWMKDYLEYTSGHEAPEDFHVWVGLTIIGASLRRSVWWDNVYYKLYPNLYTVLVSPPGVGKKTTAINIGVDILKSACPEVKIIAEKATPEGLAHRLSRPIESLKDAGGLKIEVRSEALLVAPELTTFLGREQYNEGLIVCLTRLYDCANELEVTTISRKVEKLRNVFAAFLGATTPSELGKAIPASASGGGLMSRLNIIQKDGSPRSVPFAVPIDSTYRELLVNRLQALSKVSGPIPMTGEGKIWYEDYYKRVKLTLENNPNSQFNIERQPDHVVKVAMILAASEEGPLELNADNLERSLMILEEVRKGVGDVIKLVDSNEHGEQCQYVISAIKKNGGKMSHSDLLRRCYRKMNAKVFGVIIDTLKDADVLREFLIHGKRRAYILCSFDDAGGS